MPIRRSPRKSGGSTEQPVTVTPKKRKRIAKEEIASPTKPESTDETDGTVGIADPADESSSAATVEPSTNAHRSHYFNDLTDDQVSQITSVTSSRSLQYPSLEAQYRIRLVDRLADEAPAEVLGYRKALLQRCGEKSALQNDLLKLMSAHVDLFFPNRTMSTAAEIQSAYCLHALNHVLINRQIIMDHNEKMRKLCEKLAPRPVETPEAYRDQGVVRPKVLILVPFRSRALAVVNRLAELLFGESPNSANVGDGERRSRKFVTHRERFTDEFSLDPSIKESKRTDLPPDYKHTFEGNIDDCFRIGITVAKNSLKLYADYYSSDIIVASPLGLRSIMGAEGDDDYEYDFLASIELLIVDECDVLLMQNWAHLLHIMEHLHRTPKQDRGADYSRVHLWALNGWSTHYRQTLLFSDVSAPEFRSIFTKFCTNYAGQVFVKPTIPVDGACGQIFARVSQTFHRFSCTKALDAPDARFEYFKTNLLAKWIDSHLSHIMIVVADYYDFVRLRNYMKRESMSAVYCSEYTTNKKIAAARALFFNASKNMLVVTERWHFYKRYQLRGVHHIVFYQPPLYPKLYAEFSNMLQLSVIAQPGLMISSTTLYCQFDVQRLCGMLGEDRTAQMLASDRPIHIITNE